MNMHPSLPSDSDLPPPTFNTLDSQQKTRLIRTTRKLGAVLGTTPHLAEGRSPAFSPSRPPLNPEKSLPRPKCSPKSDRSRRQGSVFEAAPSSNSYSFDYASSSADTSSASLSLPRTSTDSSNSDASTQSLPTPRSFARHVRDKSMSNSSKRAPLPTPLVLRLNAVALPPSDPRLTPPDSATTLKGPGSAPRSGARTPMPVTPTTPGTPATPTATETRRRRLAKLKRTLGENVPAELVIPAPRAAPSRRASPLDGPALAAFPLLSAPQRQAEQQHQQQQQYHAMAMTMRARPPPPPPRTQKSYPLPYAAPGSSSTGARVSPRKRSVSVDFKGGLGFMAPPHVASASAPVTSPPPKPHTQPYTQPQPQAQAQAQTQAQGIRRAPSLSSRRRPAWAAASPPPPPRPEPVGSVDSGSGAGSESGSESGHGRGWVTGGTSWKGEWNRKDIHEVQRQLRNLKLR